MMISRNCEKPTLQDVDLQNLIICVDDLKSRIYKAFFEKSRLKVYQLQLLLINEPQLISLALIRSSEESYYTTNHFELGYLTLCLSGDLYIDASYCHYYRECFALDIACSLQLLVKQAKHLLLAWCIKPYRDYLLSRKKILCCQPRTAEMLNHFIDSGASRLQYIVSFNVKSLFSYFYLSTLIDRLYLCQSIRLYLLKYLDSSVFSHLIICLDLSCSYSAFQEYKSQPFILLLNVLISCICCEIHALLSSAYVLNGYANTLSLAHYSFTVLIVCQDLLHAQSFLKELKSFLIFNGTGLQKDLCPDQSSLLTGISFKSLSVISLDKVYPFRLAAKPSLYSQFALMNQLSFLLNHAISQPLFLVIIRMNRLLLAWSDIYASRHTGKVFCLVDYLIHLKLNLFMKKHNVRLRKFQVLLLVRPQRVMRLNSLKDSVFAVVNSCDAYIYYIYIRVFLIYQIKCLLN